ncbi:hypothetical protein M0657_001794 [Pyricularia oryzae]|uniref:Uncharacterized protein n=1 Tax=Pyricularia oryzae TaxID=318829 RepID=A0A4P7MXM0_PYROR|nr:hypothetical protein M9X92_000992 [Pyricularia oryzae]KAI7930325.1 hypothetical protein M0657_001794 [Pyricularia oryzae]QBZ53911.1 hypothetical protein PoMZ_09601 [Pyricularia oryzae]
MCISGTSEPKIAGLEPLAQQLVRCRCGPNMACGGGFWPVFVITRPGIGRFFFFFVLADGAIDKAEFDELWYSDSCWRHFSKKSTPATRPSAT